MLPNSEIVLRLVISAIIGGIIGAEREMNNRPAGLRTHILVTLGSTLIMLVSIDGFTTADPARLAAQVVSGIGFLGAGTIMKTGNNIVGLTTAASLWVSAGIGLAIGGGYYVGGFTVAFIVLLTLLSLGLFEKRNLRRKYRTIEVVGVHDTKLIEIIGSLFTKYDISIRDIKIINGTTEDNESEMMKLQLMVKLPSSFDRESFDLDVFNIDEIIGIYFGKS